jgi:hypothetical protein
VPVGFTDTACCGDNRSLLGNWVVCTYERTRLTYEVSRVLSFSLFLRKLPDKLASFLYQILTELAAGV